jgi:hypothetical protein
VPVTLSPYALTTLETAKEHLGIPALTTTFDDRIKRFINAATDKIETYCDRMFKQRTGIVEYQDGFANNRLLLDQWPALKPSELWIDPTGLFTNPIYTIDPAFYALDRSARGEGIGVVLLSGLVFRRGTRNIKMVYDAGFTTIPAGLEDCCLWTMEYLYDMQNDKRIGISQKGKNQENTTFRNDLPVLVKETLAAYKRAEWPTGDRAVFTG